MCLFGFLVFLGFLSLLGFQFFGFFFKGKGKNIMSFGWLLQCMPWRVIIQGIS